MILHCTKCETRYLVADTAIGESGRVVRCANCGYNWFQAGIPQEAYPLSEGKPEAVTEAPRQEEHSPEPIVRKRPLLHGSNLPALIVIHRAPALLKWACVMLLPLIIVLTPFAYRKTIIGNHPELTFLFEPFGIYNTEGLALADISLTRNPASGKAPQTMTLECAVINEAKGSRMLPAVAATMLNSSGKPLYTSPDLVETGKNMVSGDLQHCRPFVFTANGNEVAQVRIDLADRFDLTLRRK